ncbi:MAG TPA: hypothetical protein VMT62_02560 [Syntrophorhabdaceae bacterium]|nr:hypothetical protein [Syntrophorhabdaceae bacterium]
MKLWILSSVKRGFIREPEIFDNPFEARKRKRELLKNFNPDYDEIAIFKKQIEPRSPADGSLA